MVPSCHRKRNRGGQSGLRQIRTEGAKRPSLPATKFGVRPGEFPLGSIESRAAARHIIEGRGAAEKKGTLIHFEIVRIGQPHDPDAGKCTSEPPPASAVAFCTCLSKRRRQSRAPEGRGDEPIEPTPVLITRSIDI